MRIASADTSNSRASGCPYFSSSASSIATGRFSAPTGQVRERYAKVFGEKPRSRHKTYLIRRIAWRLQAIEEGGLSERARRRAEELANEADVRVTPPRTSPISRSPRLSPAILPIPSSDSRLPSPGTVIVRRYKGQPIRVLVLSDGLEFNGNRYKSLSAVAKCIPEHYADGGFSGGNMERPALDRLLRDIEAGKIDCVVVYKVDRLSRSLLDFAKIMDTFEKHSVSFVSVTQQFIVRNRYGALLKGLLYCESCQRAMVHTFTGRGTRFYRYYTCAHAIKSGRSRCPTGSLPAAEIENAVVDQIRCLANDNQLRKEVLNQTRAHKGCLSMFGDNPVTHRLFAEHVTAEFRVKTEGRGRTVDEWKLRAAAVDNHWLDCLVGCAVAASIQGAILPGTDVKASTKRPRIRLSDLQRGR